MEQAVSLSGPGCNDQCRQRSFALLPGYLGVGSPEGGSMGLWSCGFLKHIPWAMDVGHLSYCGPRAEWTLPGDLGLNEAETSSRDN